MPELTSASTSSTEDHRTDSDDLSIYLLTYNVANQSPTEHLVDLFDFQHHERHHIYVIALEELYFLSMITWDPFMNQLDAIFAQRGYVRLERARYMITSLSIYVLKSKLTSIHHVTKDTVTTDLAMRKGAIGIRLYYNNISLAFIGAHLAAHEEYYQLRLKNYNEIIEELRFSDQPKDGVLDQDYCFFLGDLNFRLNHLTSKQVYMSILFQENPWVHLLEYDQLRLAQQTKQAFHHFEEATITFPPTYRFIISTDKYDWQNRKPAFTDRILYRDTLSSRVNNQNCTTLRVVSYGSLKKYRGSDHKPVRAVAYIPEGAFEAKNKLLHQSRRLLKTKKEITRAKMHTVGSTTETTTTSFVPDHRSYYHEDPSLFHQIRVHFQPIRTWTHNHTVYFRVVDIRFKQTIGADNPMFFQVLSTCDWIGLYKEDFHSLDSYITFAYPRFSGDGGSDTVEEAEDALALLSVELKYQQSTSLDTGSSFVASFSSQSTSSTVCDDDDDDDTLSGEVVVVPDSSAFQLSSVKEKKEKKEENDGKSPSNHSSSSSTLSSPSKSSMSSSKTTSWYVFVDETDVDSSGSELTKKPNSLSANQTNSDVFHHSSSSSTSSSSSSSPTSSASTSLQSSPPIPSPGQVFSAIFDQQSFLVFTTARYVLIYRRKNGDVLGISEPFEIESKPEEGVAVTF